MNLPDLYKRLALGELSNLAMSEDGNILEDEREKIVLHANEGLKRLYTRFQLKEETLFLEQKGFLTNYYLSSKYAQSNYDVGAGHSFYINDLGKPFLDDVLRVLEVRDGLGRKVPLNEPHMWRSVFTPQPTVLQIPHPVEGCVLAVNYQAAHPKLDVEDETAEIILPEFLSEALNAYIAHKVFDHMNTQESAVKAAIHMKAFDTICVEVIEQDLVTRGATTSGYRFEQNGWT